MNKLLASVVLVSLTGCAVAPLNSEDVGSNSSALKAQVPPPPAVTANILLSSTGGAGTYPDSSQITFAQNDKKAFAWVYLDNVPVGAHVAWVTVTDPSGEVVSTIPIPFGTAKKFADAELFPANWPTSLITDKANTTTTGYEVRTTISFSDFAAKKKNIPLGAYQVSVVMDDNSSPCSTDSNAGTATLYVAAPTANAQ